MTKPAAGQGEALDATVTTEPGDDEPRRLAEGTVIGFQTQLDDARAAFATFTAKIEKIQGHLDGARQGLADAESDIPRLEAELASAEAELENI